MEETMMPPGHVAMVHKYLYISANIYKYLHFEDEEDERDEDATGDLVMVPKYL